MDLYAYSQMGDLSNILASTGIEIPCLRDLRLMADETKMTKEELTKGEKSPAKLSAGQVL